MYCGTDYVVHCSRGDGGETVLRIQQDQIERFVEWRVREVDRTVNERDTERQKESRCYTCL